MPVRLDPDRQLFHRAHGYERYQLRLLAPAFPEATNRTCRFKFRHATGVDETTVSLVYPLTNVGSAA